MEPLKPASKYCSKTNGHVNIVLIGLCHTCVKIGEGLVRIAAAKLKLTVEPVWPDCYILTTWIHSLPRPPSARTCLYCWTRSGPGRSPSASWSAGSAASRSSGRWPPTAWMQRWSNVGGTRRRWEMEWGWGGKEIARLLKRKTTGRRPG